jgi:hypothetical protein
MTMQLIETKTLGTAAASIEFTSIPQDGTDLIAKVSARDTATSSFGVTVLLKPNGSTSNLSQRRLFGLGSGSPASDTTTQWRGIGVATNQTSNTFGNTEFYIANYAGSTNKSASIDGAAENNATDNFMLIGALLWSDTSAITSITFSPDPTFNFQIGTTISLYKITKGSSGGVTTS